MASKPLIIVLVLAGSVAPYAAHRWLMSTNVVAAYVSTEQQDPLEQIVEDVTELTQVVAKPDSDADVPSTASYLINRIDENVNRALKEANPSPDLVTEARTAQVRAYHMASVRFPTKYRPRFAELSEQLMRDLPDSPVAFEASLLHFMTEHDLTKPFGKKELQALNEQADSYRNKLQGVAIHSIVSQRLHSNGQANSAKAVLDAGLEKFRGEAGWNHLFQQQFDQGYLVDPKPQYATGASKLQAKCEQGRVRRR